MMLIRVSLKYLINKNILNKSNYTDIKYKIFVLDKGFLPFNNMVLTNDSIVGPFFKISEILRNLKKKP